MFNEIFWATRLCALHEAACIITIISVILFVIFLISHFFDDSDGVDNELSGRIIKILLTVICVCSICIIALPNKTDLSLIYGWEALKSDKAREIYDTVMKKIGGSP